ncbi:MAG: hypothetical protein HC785_15080 [Calothrix sp. CSU_2_0]|nr:hypothetical protein [Calothrix sp. CSU_2_0]
MKNSNQSQLLITAVLTIILASTSSIAQTSKDSCAKLRNQKAPQPIFVTAYDGDLKNSLVVAKNNNTTGTLAKKETSESGNYYFAMSDRDEPNSVNIFADKSYSLKVNIESLKYRPMKAKWVNAKLLFIEVSINPHRSIYWLFDVEKQQVVSAELEEDGEIEWQECQRQSS